jgi:hypothetical protein
MMELTLICRAVTCEEIEGALKYLKNNKAASVDSISQAVQKRWTLSGGFIT